MEEDPALYEQGERILAERARLRQEGWIGGLIVGLMSGMTAGVVVCRFLFAA